MKKVAIYRPASVDEAIQMLSKHGAEAGVYAFKTSLTMAGRWQFTLAAKVQGEPDTVTGVVIVRATQ